MQYLFKYESQIEDHQYEYFKVYVQCDNLHVGDTLSSQTNQTEGIVFWWFMNHIKPCDV